MAASLGTAVHASIEDLLQIDLSGRKPEETHWLPEMAETFLRQRWEEEKEIFFATPRRPMWKEKEWDKAKRMQRGAIKMLLELHFGMLKMLLEQHALGIVFWGAKNDIGIAFWGDKNDIGIAFWGDTTALGI